MQKQELLPANDRNRDSGKRAYYHIVISAKYRDKMMPEGVVSERLKQIIANIAEENDWKIFKLKIRPEHIHLLLSAHVDVSPSKITGKDISIYEGMEPEREIFKTLKGKTSYEMGKDFKWPRGGYIGTISREKMPTKDLYKDLDYISESASHKVHILFYSYKCNRKKLEELLGDNLLNLGQELKDIVNNKKYGPKNNRVFKDLQFKPNETGNITFCVRTIQTFPPIWILKSLFRKIVPNPTKTQIDEWLDNWHISSQGIDFDRVQQYIDSHDDPRHYKKCGKCDLALPD